MSSDRPLRVLYVCTGNVCRSPMAEAITRTHAETLGLDLDVRSAGTMDLRGAPADPKVVAVCREIGVELGEHRSMRVDAETAAWADRVLVMELTHAAYLNEHHPDEVADKLELLGRMGGGEAQIADPIGAFFKFRFRRCRDEISGCVRGFLSTV